MNKYITKTNVLVVMLFLQFAITTYLEIYDPTPEVVRALSFIGLLIGYWVNSNKRQKE